MKNLKHKEGQSLPERNQPKSDLSETTNMLESSGIKVEKREGWAVQFVPNKKDSRRLKEGFQVVAFVPAAYARSMNEELAKKKESSRNKKLQKK